MLHRWYARVLALSARPGAPWWLALVAFAEASVFPVPPDVLLVPMALARPRRAWLLAAICTAASVAGGALGYLIGFRLFNTIAHPLLEAYGYLPAFAAFQARYAEYGMWVILLKGLTPIPYKIVTIASGAARFDFATFMLASLVTRGARFFLLAGLLRLFGDRARVFIDRWLGWVVLAVLLAGVAGFAALKYL